MYYSHKRLGYSGPEYWRLFDLMPKSVREQLNNAKTIEETFYLWQRAINEYGDEVEKIINEIRSTQERLG